jgi:hypothetical protein
MTQYPPAIQKRIAIVDETAHNNLDAINARIGPHMPRFKARVKTILSAPKSVTNKIIALWELADEMMAFNGKNVACKRGCSHCCHIAVAVHPAEADVIGKRIGRVPRKDVTLRSNFKGFDYGYHNPCTFLMNGQCSIYANRPLACRVQYSLDVDSLLCELNPLEPVPVPYINPLKFNYALAQIVQPAQRESSADIREFFPSAKP